MSLLLPKAILMRPKCRSLKSAYNPFEASYRYLLGTPPHDWFLRANNYACDERFSDQREQYRAKREMTTELMGI